MERNNGRIAATTLIYSFIYSICLYKNLTGVMTPLFSVATVVFIWIILPELVNDKEEARLKRKRLIPYFIGVVLLGISIFMTADLLIILFSYIGIILLTMAALIRFFCDEESWGVGRYSIAIIEVCAMPIVYVDRLFRDRKSFNAALTSKKNKKLKYVIIGILFSIPFLIVVITLLASADAIFGSVVNAVFGGISISGETVGFLFLTGAVMIYCYSLLYKLSVHGAGNVNVTGNKLEAVIGIAFTGMLTAVYVLFSVIQILSPFLGESMLPDGYSYSNYAREGFFQLLFVAAFNLVAILICNAIFAKHKVLNIVLTIMCACTYIMIASSAVRMAMYIDAFALTYLRLLVCFALLLIGILLIGVIISIYNEKFKLMRYFIAVTSVLYISLAFVHPEYIIAKYNLSQPRLDTSLSGFDSGYLARLSSDAAPAIYDYMQEHDGAEDIGTMTKLQNFEGYFARVDRQYDEYNEYYSIRGFNLSRYKAHLCAEKYKN
ncbi:MAG: DUF4173 domain-containing protein [Lachnospiraceae bacterium]|nr:DUF4173 domain-containing protein [Lachnospiraceae bacterium]